MIPTGSGALEGRLAVPEDALGMVVFAHGSGSSRHSERNRYVADALYEAGLGTLLFDLLRDEEQHRRYAFDVPLLTERLTAVTNWLQDRPGPQNEWIGYFGASTGAAAALSAATAPGVEVRAIVCRGGRPDLAVDDLPNVRTPTLLVVGERDEAVLDYNYAAQRLLGGTNRLAVVPGATHLFEEPGALESVAELAGEWFAEYLGAIG
ncbi:dienelactone hydrolase family protein [Glycomyces sp. TRM65418]|uniref:dienelactone hydrolase family protein n=1 Tax=Glycomyces sp. TRM65418 TaxID=2867006 RepID=UPI001D160CE2|nr:alpha/beta family hydrolase [Glycomyces sp. TRM65418]MCC3765328.1 dienelactone hydrolase family protein [Glycomyces sp. TRM65418]